MRIGIDLGGTKIEGILLGPARSTLARIRRVTPPDHDYSAVLDAIVALVRDLEIQAARPCSVGIGTPGAPSRITRRMKNCNTTSLNGRCLQDDLQARLGREIRLANDANCFALSEALDGAGTGHAVVFGVILGTGCGGGIVVSGRIHDGPNAIAGEWGHTSIDPEGPPCYCGDRGCIETFLSGPGLERDFRHGGGPSGVGGAEIARRATAGDGTARAALDRYVERFGRSLAMVVDVLDPDCIVLGGGLSGIDRLYDDGPAAVARNVFGGEFNTPILRNCHGDSSGVRGAAMLWPDDVT